MIDKLDADEANNEIVSLQILTSSSFIHEMYRRRRHRHHHYGISAKILIELNYILLHSISQSTFPLTTEEKVENNSGKFLSFTRRHSQNC